MWTHKLSKYNPLKLMTWKFPVLQRNKLGATSGGTVQYLWSQKMRWASTENDKLEHRTVFKLQGYQKSLLMEIKISVHYNHKHM